ncbi:uncharacterized protein LOC135842292 isoform X2 [Planococcus citri]|uniref:uncharacterized protein LOC135842292 isoform X2 n=1 Tax=Planococcus citri TaxID=170843 RepID=UPI0031F98140
MERKNVYIDEGRIVGKSSFYRNIAKLNENVNDDRNSVNADSDYSCSSDHNNSTPVQNESLDASACNNSTQTQNENPDSSDDDFSHSQPDQVFPTENEHWYQNCCSDSSNTSYCSTENNSPRHIESTNNLMESTNASAKPFGFFNLSCSQKNPYDELKFQLLKWGHENKITRECGNQILKIVKQIQFSDVLEKLPTDFRTVMAVPLNKETSPTIISKCGGQYIYFGIENFLNTVGGQPYFDPTSSALKLSINVDGLPISKSSTKQFWPILGSFGQCKVFIIALFLGTSKPDNANDFLNDFVAETNTLIKNGVNIKGKLYEFDLEKVIADAPAKSFVFNLKSHVGYNSCVKCTVVGKRKHHRIFFPEKGEPRDKNHFIKNQNEVDLSDEENDHAVDVNDDDDDGDFCKETSIVTSIEDLDLPMALPFDYMHSICLGSTKKLIEFWSTNKHKPIKRILDKKVIKKIDEKIDELKKYTPVEFNRKPRSFHDIGRWKATELRQFILYTGPSVLKNLLPKKYYQHFLRLHYCTRVLCMKSIMTPEVLDYVEVCLEKFITKFVKLYDESLVNHNIHSLFHILSDCRKFLNLDNFSAFKYENFLKWIKETLKSGNRPLEQVKNRYLQSLYIRSKNIDVDTNDSSEFQLLKKFNEGISEQGEPFEQFRQLKLKDSIFQTNNIKNSVCLTFDGTIVKIESITRFSNGTIEVQGRQFKEISDYYTTPCDSSPIGIYLAGKLSRRTCSMDPREISNKCYVIPETASPPTFYVASLVHQDFL